MTLKAPPKMKPGDRVRFLDGQAYVKQFDGSLRRDPPKVRGKKERKRERLEREFERVQREGR